jgi:hypothetical protein
MRVGTNQFEMDDVQFDSSNSVSGGALSPYLEDKLDEDAVCTVGYEDRHKYYTFTEEQRAEYDKNFIRTFINVHNTVFMHPGIFAIGMDSHFAGTALAKGEVFSSIIGNAEGLKSWYNLAKTSYGVKLTLTGDVKMYCWNKLDRIDSSSLIEISGVLNMGALSNDTLSFDIKDLVRNVVKGNPKAFSTVIYNQKV